MHTDRGGSIAATTSWTLISRTREPGEPARQATASLCRMYWQPLYVHARRSGQGAHEAEDTVQEFLVHVCEHEVFARADASRGRFRTFLLSSLQQFMARRHRDATRLKRAPSDGRGVVSLDVESGERAVADSPAGLTPDRAFDRAWALAQVDLVWERIEAEARAAGKGELCAQLRPVVSGKARTPAKEIAAALGMSEGAVNVAAHRMRRQFGEYLREQVAGTLERPEEVDDEIAQLRAALAGRA